MKNLVVVTVIPVDELYGLLPEKWQQALRQWLPKQAIGAEIQVYSEIKAGRVIQHFDLVNDHSCFATGEMPEMIRHLSGKGLNLVARGSLLAVDQEGMYPKFLAEGDDRLLLTDEAAWLLNVDQELVDRLRRVEPKDRLPLFRQAVPSNHCADIYNEAIRTVNLL